MPVIYARGAPKPPSIIFVHGSPGDHSVWKPLLDRAPGSCRCVVLDLPDHGVATDELSEQLEVLEVDIADAIIRERRFGAGAPVLVVGQSLGAYLVAKLLPELGDSVERAVLISGFPSLPESVVEGRNALIEGLESGDITREAFRATAVELFLGPRRTTKQELLVAEMIEGTSTERLLRMLRRGNQAGDPGHAVKSFDTPAVVIHDAHDPAIPHELGAALADLGDRAELVTLEDSASHLPQVARVDEIARWVYPS